MTSPELQASLQSGPHKMLNLMTGQWTGQTKTWFEPGEPVDDSPATGTIRTLFDGRALLHEYKGSFQGKDLEGIAIYSYDLKTQTFQAAWMDTFHTGTSIMFSEGAKEAAFFKVSGSYLASPDNPEQWGWRTEIVLNERDELVITAYNIAPNGAESKATETVYRRM